jgi:hypothetical protein
MKPFFLVVVDCQLGLCVSKVKKENPEYSLRRLFSLIRLLVIGSMFNFKKGYHSFDQFEIYFYSFFAVVFVILCEFKNKSNVVYKWKS